MCVPTGALTPVGSKKFTCHRIEHTCSYRKKELSIVLARVAFNIRPFVVFLLSIAATIAVATRAIEAVRGLQTADETAFLAFPLAVMIPALAFLFLATRRGMSSQEGVLMQLGTMVQLLLIIALPRYALYLALGFPVVFLVVELFETRSPAKVRDWVKKQVVSC